MKSGRDIELDLDRELDGIKTDIMADTETWMKLRNREITEEQAIEWWIRDYVKTYLL